MVQKFETVIWTALPNGVKQTEEGSFLKLSVFVSPRLWTDDPKPRLELFDDFLKWWTTSNAVIFQVEFEGGPTLEVQPTFTDSEKDLKKKLWTELFPADTYVRPHEFDNYDGLKVISYPVDRIVDFIKDTYSSIATETPNKLPTLTSLRDRFAPMSFYPVPFGVTVPRMTEQAAVQKIEQLLDQYKAVVPEFYQDLKPQDQTALDFIQVKLFHTQTNPNPYNEAELAGLFEPIDFHQIVSSLGDYPQLLRRLGLVLDLEVPFPVAVATVPIPTIPANSRVRVTPKWFRSLPGPGSGNPDAKPWTAYIITTDNTGKPTSFLAASKGNLVNGMLNLSDSQSYEVVQIDVDGAALNTMHFAHNTQRMTSSDHATTDTPQEVGLPALRTGGFSIAKKKRALGMVAAFKSAATLNDAAEDYAKTPQSPKLDAQTLDAEDLVRGYYVDVWDNDAKVWYSLCWRVGDYRFGPDPKNPIDELTIVDEGFVTVGATQQVPPKVSPPPPPPTNLHLHESLFRWTGWSLTVPRSGKVIDQKDMAENRPNEAASGSVANLKVSFAPLKYSEIVAKKYPEEVIQSATLLPRLRFGRAYSFRVRCADLAGNDMSKAAGGPPGDFTAASSLVRYTRFEPLSSPAVVPRKAFDPASSPPQVFSPGESLERLVIRSNKGVDTQTYKNNYPGTQLKDKFDVFNERYIAPPMAAEQMAEAHGRFDAAMDAKDSQKFKEWYYTIVSHEGSFNEVTTITEATTNTTKFEQGVHPEEPLHVPYLPDPIARGAAFQGLPGQPAPFQIDLSNADDQWPDARPIRIKLVEGSAPASDFDPGSRVLTVRLPKAEVARVRMSSYLFPDSNHPQDDRSLLGIQQWVSEKAGPLLSPKGNHPMLTPFRDLYLVHAVQQPLEEPQFSTGTTASRQIGDTFAHLVGSLSVHGKSTVKLDVLAEWHEPVDLGPGTSSPQYDPENPPVHPGAAVGKAHAYEIKTLPEYASVLLGPPGTPVSLTPSTILFTSPHNFGDTKYRRITYTTVASSRFKEYFGDDANLPPEKPLLDTTTVGPPVTIDVPSSARPDSPKVLYIVPTFGWTEPDTSEPGKIKGTRYGRGLRVYLDRPWFSSGEGELLGVVVSNTRPGGPIPVPDQLKSYVTQWGEDPLWASSHMPAIAPVANNNDFPNTTKFENELSLDELPGKVWTVSVAGHAVEYDKDRDLWYSDIEMGLGGSPPYYPFVRLALARYQPISVVDTQKKVDVKLSRVVLTDFAQLAPDRTATITSTGEAKVNVTVTGITYKKSAVGESTTQIYVTVEEQDPNIDPKSDFAWAPVPGQTPIFPGLKHPIPAADPEAGGVGYKLEPSKPGRGPEYQWTGEIPLPEKPGGSRKFRLVVKEFEYFFADEQPSEFVILPVPRLVYADVIYL